MISVTKFFEFEAAHYLPGYNGDCKNIHGHSYKLEVSISGEIEKEGPHKGMIVDFSLLKIWINELIISKLDHKNLNEVFENPTAENMVIWIARTIVDNIPETVNLEKVRLWETSTSYATWRRE